MSSLVNWLSAVLLLLSIILLACRELKVGITLSTLAVLLVGLNIAFPEKEYVYVQQGQRNAVRAAVNPTQSTVPPVPAAQKAAVVTDNVYVPKEPVPPPPPAVKDTSQLLLPVRMESKGDYAAQMKTGSVAPSCGQPYKLVPNMPPMPGVAQFTGDSVWRLPEYPVDESCRGESLNAVVADLPTCNEATPMQTIRNHGLYGIKGNLSCSLLQRSAVADTGFLQPLGARNAFLSYNAYDQIHAKDPYMIPVIPEIEQQRTAPGQ